MHKLLKISWLNVKNAAYSKQFLVGLIAAFSYSMLWIFLVHPKLYELSDYDFEFGRFLYVIMLYAAVSILRNDIRNNTTKTIFTGAFSRIEIMTSKGIGLIIWGIIFAIVVEINNVLAACILHKKIGFAGFLAFGHLKLIITCIVITLTMGGLMLLIISIKFDDRKSILFFILIISMINFYTAAISSLVYRDPSTAQNFSTYMKTPFYNVESLMQGSYSTQAVLINLAWAAVFLITSILIINKREIK